MGSVEQCIHVTLSHSCPSLVLVKIFKRVRSAEMQIMTSMSMHEAVSLYHAGLVNRKMAQELTRKPRETV